MLVDVASDDAGIRVDFFGAPALVSSAAARIALRTNAWVVPAVVVRGPEDDLEIRPIIDIEPARLHAHRRRAARRRTSSRA